MYIERELYSYGVRSGLARTFWRIGKREGDNPVGEDAVVDQGTSTCCPHRAPSTVGLRQTEYYCRGDDSTSRVVLGFLSFLSVLILCHLTPLILRPTQRRQPTDSQRAGHGLLSEQINSRASACYNWTWMIVADLILIAPSSGSINFALSMQRIMDQVMRVPV